MRKAAATVVARRFRARLPAREQTASSSTVSSGTVTAQSGYRVEPVNRASALGSYTPSTSVKPLSHFRNRTR
jgi:hypothetical protein